MNWFNGVKKILFKKTASKAEIKNRALQQLQQGADPAQVASQFVTEMSRTDPNFARGPWTSMIMEVSNNPSQLTNVISIFNPGKEQSMMGTNKHLNIQNQDKPQRFLIKLLI
jgi:hypothetical protein